MAGQAGQGSRYFMKPNSKERKADKQSYSVAASEAKSVCWGTRPSKLRGYSAKDPTNSSNLAPGITGMLSQIEEHELLNITDWGGYPTWT